MCKAMTMSAVLALLFGCAGPRSNGASAGTAGPRSDGAKAGAPVSPPSVQAAPAPANPPPAAESVRLHLDRPGDNWLGIPPEIFKEGASKLPAVLLHADADAQIEVHGFPANLGSPAVMAERTKAKLEEKRPSAAVFRISPVSVSLDGKTAGIEVTAAHGENVVLKGKVVFRAAPGCPFVAALFGRWEPRRHAEMARDLDKAASSLECRP